MKKIPSVFKRDYAGTRRVYDEVVPGCEWVLNGEGFATEKIDGTSCLMREGKLYKRYDAKKGRTPPPEWEAAEPAPNEHTGHWPGWLPVGDDPEDKWHRAALEANPDLPDGTYELIGPKVQGNPHGVDGHQLIKHGSTELAGVPRDFDGIRDWLADHPVEGIVWYHPDGRMAKIKRRDFGLDWPPQ